MSSSPSAPPPSSGKPAAVRLIELDGLRGLAAVVVLIHHALETVPALAEVGARPGLNAFAFPLTCLVLALLAPARD